MIDKCNTLICRGEEEEFFFWAGILKEEIVAEADRTHEVLLSVRHERLLDAGRRRQALLTVLHEKKDGNYS